MPQKSLMSWRRTDVHTAAEKEEQQRLRTAYLADIRAQVKGMLDRVEIVDVVEEEQTVRRGISGKYKRR